MLDSVPDCNIHVSLWSFSEAINVCVQMRHLFYQHTMYLKNNEKMLNANMCSWAWRSLLEMFRVFWGCSVEQVVLLGQFMGHVSSNHYDNWKFIVMLLPVIALIQSADALRTGVMFNKVSKLLPRLVPLFEQIKSVLLCVYSVNRL